MRVRTASIEANRGGHVAVLDLAPSAPGTLQEPASAVGVMRVAIALFFVANLGRIPLVFVGNKDAPVLATDIGVLAVCAVGTWIALRHRTFRVDMVAAAALLFAAIGALSAVLAVPRFGLSPFQLAFSLAYLVRWLAYFGLYLVAINFLARRDVTDIWRALETLVLAFAAFGIVQSIFMPGFAQMVDPGSELYVDWDPQGHRLVSTFLDPNLAGGLIMIVLLVMFAWLAMGEGVANWKVGLLSVALVLTVSRSAVLGMMAGTALIIAARGLSRRLVRIGGALFALLLLALPWLLSFAADYGKLKIEGSAMERLITWARAIEVLGDNLLIGIGFNTYGFVQEAYGYQPVGRASFTLDGGLLFAAVMTGFVGLAVFCAMLALQHSRCRAIWRDRLRTPYDRGLALGVAASTIALVVHSIFVNSLFFPFLMGPLWILWGVVFLIRRPAVAEGGES